MYLSMFVRDMHGYIFMCACIHVCVCMYVCRQACISIYICICMYADIHTGILMYVSMEWMHIGRLHKCMYVCANIYIHANRM